jgi:hypothetical protein
MLPFGRMETLSFAWLGTAIAGGLYPVVLIGVELGFRPLPAVVAELILSSLLGFVLGFIYAGMVGAVFTVMAWIFAACAGVERRLIWLGSIAGGWTGFFCTLPFSERLPGGPLMGVLVAAFFGQTAAALGVHLAVRSNRKIGATWGAESQSPEKLRIGLRQVFGAMTFFCVLAAAIGAIQPTREVYQLMAAAALLQGFMILIARP